MNSVFFPHLTVKMFSTLPKQSVIFVIKCEESHREFCFSIISEGMINRPSNHLNSSGVSWQKCLLINGRNGVLITFDAAFFAAGTSDFTNIHPVKYSYFICGGKSHCRQNSNVNLQQISPFPVPRLFNYRLFKHLWFCFISFVRKANRRF